MYLETERLTLQGNSNLYSQFNLIQYEMTLTLFVWLSYQDTTILHGNLVISYLRLLMPWYDKGEGDTPIYRTPWFIYCCYVFTFYTLLYFYSFLHLYLIIQISIRTEFYTSPWSMITIFVSSMSTWENVEESRGNGRYYWKNSSLADRYCNWYSCNWFNRCFLLQFVFWIGFISLVIGGSSL